MDRLEGPPRLLGVSADGTSAVYQLASGEFAFGTVAANDATKELEPALPPDAARGSHEKIVRIPRDLLVGIRQHIPDS